MRIAYAVLDVGRNPRDMHLVNHDPAVGWVDDVGWLGLAESPDREMQSKSVIPAIGGRFFLRSHISTSSLHSH